MIQDLKTQLASEQIREFLERMRSLGFTREEVISLMEGQVEAE